MRHCLIKSGTVENVVLWDGATPVDFGDAEVVGVDDDCYVAPGFLYDGKEFSPPPGTETKE